jgi:hypothetical protein
LTGSDSDESDKSDEVGECRRAEISGANFELVFHSFNFSFCCLVSTSFHRRGILEEGVGHLLSYRKSTDK